MKNKQLNKSIRKELNFDLKSYLANNKLLTESIQENKEIDSDLLEIVEEEINSMLDEEYKLKDIKLNYKLFIENKLYTKGLSQIKKLSNENPSINYDIMEILHSGFYSLKDEEYKLKDIINAYNKVLTTTVTESSNQTTTNNTPRSKIANSIIKLVSNSYNESDLINLLNSLGPVKPEILKKEAFKLEKLLDILSVNFDSDFPEIQLYYYGFKNYEGTKDIIFKDNKWTTR